MMLDWQHFTPWSALAGGVLIGLAAGMLALLAGRIAGVSGIVGALLQQDGARSGWRWAFVAGLLAAPLGWLAFQAAPTIQLQASPFWMVIAGLLVGIGTRYANGCTSGHGVCGLSRLSVRSLVAVLVFMGTGFATVFVLRHLL
ncbi:YeeE/YedE family protein [Chitinolyticbacter meiyuanensis]|uniref:YeeE/YedE family protein n=1 Tax=Chitinolyticbacter meiyuanensis TaxID=682798 RepID=UPI0011E5D4E0|nr:YeeE/YedE thiosulfate transporter family protein [Chitinolyticbacter meiyuanensis]